MDFNFIRFPPVKRPHREAWNTRPRAAGAFNADFERLADITTNTTIVIRYGDIDKYSTGIDTPAA
jgi:hypothetical protein